MKDPRDWDLEYDGAAPPLPEELRRYLKPSGKDGTNWAELLTQLLPDGAYFLLFEPKIAEVRKVETPNVFAGVLRIHHRRVLKRKDKEYDTLLSSGSGDLYFHSRKAMEELVRDLSARFDSWEEDQIKRLEALQLECREYRYYLRLESLWITAKHQLILGFDTYRYDDGNCGWRRRQSITSVIDRNPVGERRRAGKAQPLGYGPHRVLNSSETEIGFLYIFHVADCVRHAEVELHAVPGLAVPDGQEYWERLRSAGWSITPKEGSAIEAGDAEEGLTPSDGKWTRYLLGRYHQGKIDSDTKERESWRYHVLIVDHILVGQEAESQPRGLMYDVGEIGGDDPPRQGAAVAARRETDWQDTTKELSEFPDLFHRTALHELGHMQGLYHDPANRGLMQPLEYLTEDFKKDTDLAHSNADALRLRHLPDLWVRPGGVPFGYSYRESAVDILDLVPESEGLVLRLHPLVGVAGEGPREIVLTLLNSSRRGILCPNHRHVQPRYGRIGVLLETPSGDREEVWSIRFPRPLGGFGNTSLLSGESITLRIPWNRRLAPVSQAGLYRVRTHLMWIVKRKKGKNKKEPKIESTIYRVTAESTLRAT